jgi:hypothetical protein
MAHAFNSRRHQNPAPPPPPAVAAPTANDQLAKAIVAHLGAVKPRTSDEQLASALRMLRARNLGHVSLAEAIAMVDDYASVEMFFDCATFRAAFERRFDAPDRAAARAAEQMFDQWRRDREMVERERAEVDRALAGLSRAQLEAVRDEAADEIERRPIDREAKASADEQRRDNRVEAATVRKSDPTRPGVGRAVVYARLTRRGDAGR